MSGVTVLMHALNILHGIAASVVTLAFFHVVGVVMVPLRWDRSIQGSAPAVVGAAMYVLLCWVAVSSRHIPVIYVAIGLAAAVCVIAAIRLRGTVAALRAFADGSATRWLLTFCALYTLAYVLVWPPADEAYLPLAWNGRVDLVTYARYARHVLEIGSPNIDFATFDYTRSAAAVYLLAWLSMFFGLDPLRAATPALLASAALFGLCSVHFARLVSGLSHRAAFAMACIFISSAFLRWVASNYLLSTLLASAILLHLLSAIVLAFKKRGVDGALAVSLIAACVLLSFVESFTPASLLSAARGTGEFLRAISPSAVLGFPGRMPRERIDDSARSAAFAVLVLLPIAWSGALSLLQRSGGIVRLQAPADRLLARSLAVYVAIALVAGNVAVHAVRDPEPVHVPSVWRNLEELKGLAFQALTLKMNAEPDSLSTALALYFLHTKKAQVVGSAVDVDELPLAEVSRQNPVLIHNFGCQGAGHEDTVSVKGVGCLLLAPPSMTVGTSYPFNRTFLFMGYDGMTAREPGGRWNTRPTLTLKLLADPERARLDRDMYVNLLLNPFLPSGVKPQRLVVEWGNDQRGETSVATEEWISMLVRSTDWTGNRLWELPVSIDFTDGRTILFRELSLTEAPRGRVIELSPERAL